MIRCSVCGEWFTPYTPQYRLGSSIGREDGPEPICYDCLSAIDMALYEDREGEVEEVDEDEDEY